MGVVSFGIGWFKPKTAAPHYAGFVKSTSNPMLFEVKQEEGSIGVELRIILAPTSLSKVVGDGS